jgi:ATP-dependent helicase HrpB
VISLPVDALVPEILAALAKTPSVLFIASPGSGKTTRIPWALAKTIPKGKVYVLEPRRIAAKLSAERVAEENGVRIGEEVGYQFRFERKRKDSTRLVFLTEGTLLRELQSNPNLDGIAALVLDEFHERHLQGDLALAIAKHLQSTTRPDLKILVMSATLDPVPLERFLPGAVRIELEAPRFPIEIEYAPLESTLEREVARKVRALRARPDAEAFGDVLIFLPGMAEIRRVESELRQAGGARGEEILLLHGELSREEQDRALHPSAKRKIILATNIAESSVTIPGVNTVVDAGLARVGSFSHWAGLPRLETKAISRASAIQRAGRAGRTGPGRVLRLYARGDFESRPSQDTPEILRADLTPVALDLIALGIDPRNFQWFESPSSERIDSAMSLLEMLGFVYERGKLTSRGEQASESAFHPRITRSLQEAARLGAVDTVIPALVALSEGEDLGLDFLEGMRRYRVQGFATRIRERMENFVATAGRAGAGKPNSGRGITPTGATSPKSSGMPAFSADTAITRSLLTGFHDRVGRRAANAPEMILAPGGSIPLARKSAGAAFESVDAFWSHSEFFLVLDLQESKRTGDTRARLFARTAIAIDESDLWEIDPLPIVEKTERVFDDRKKRWIESDLLIFHKLELSRTLKEAPVPSSGTPEGLPEAEWETLYEHWLEGLRGDDTKSREGWTARRIRYALLRKAYGETEGFEAETFEGMLRTLLFQNYREVTSARDLPDLGTLLGGLWQPGAFRKFRDEVPEFVELPGRKQTPVVYEEGGPPRIESRMADFFGMSEGPKILGGRMKLSLHLLAPNYRAVQVTEDLSGFWSRHYPGIRKELMRQYPRHPWPENPLIRPAPRKA